MSLRAFIAVELAEAVRRNVAALAAEFRRLGADVKWVEAENIHVTVKFLGQVEESDLRAICRVMDEAVAGIEPFGLAVAGAGSFPPGRRPRTIWVGLEEEAPHLTEIHRRLDSGLTALNVPPDRRGFAPHVTLGRSRSERGLDRLAAAIAAAAGRRLGEQQVDALTLFQSDLTPEGPVYTPLYHAALGRG
jgi:2'-5' RNA ligase